MHKLYITQAELCHLQIEVERHVKKDMVICNISNAQ